MAFTPIGDEFQIDINPVNILASPKIDADANGNFIVTWREYQYNPSSFDLVFFAQRYNPEGKPLGDKLKVDMPSRNSSPEIAVDADGDFVITWLDSVYDSLNQWSNTDIYAQRYDSDSIPQGGRLQVASFPGSTYSLDIDTDPSGDFAIVWSNLYAPDPIDNGIFAQRYNSDGIPQGSEFRVNSRQSVYGQEDLSIAMTGDGDFVIAWAASDRANGSDLDIFARRFNRNGAPRDPEFQVNTFTSAEQRDLDIAANVNGDLVIAWHSYDFSSDGSLSANDISAQRYNSDGTPEGSEFRVSSLTTNQVRDPHVAVDLEGNFAITWSAYDVPSERLSYLYAQYYNSAGIPQTGETLLREFNSDLYYFTVQSDIASTLNGEYVIPWFDKPLNSQAINARRYRVTNAGSLYITGTDASESLEGSEFADTIAGAGGNDTIRGRDGDDELQGNRGNDFVDGNSGDDLVFGGQGDDRINGSEGNDSVFGSAGNDTANGGIGNDLIGGGLDNDRLDGDEGNDSMFGGRENDSLVGGEGDDTLNGISPLSANQGQGEIDTLTGGVGKDVFILAASSRNYYDDGNSSSGMDDYALITDFNLSEGDALQLRSSINYVVSNAPVSLGLTGASLFIDTDNSGNFSTNDELIAVFQNITSANLLNAPKILV